MPHISVFWTLYMTLPLVICTNKTAIPYVIKSPDDEPPEEGISMSEDSITGVACGSVLVITLIYISILYWRKRFIKYRRKRQQNQDTTIEETIQMRDNVEKS